MPLAVRIEGTQFRDSNNREFTLHGINVAGDAKNPSSPDQPSHEPDGFFKGDDVSFVGRPFSVDDAPLHFARLRSWGYNTIRYIFTWEAISHAGPELYDEAWIDYTIEVLRVAKRYGFLVFMDPHQDVWSRFTGGSGAPLWTIYACGLDPEKFLVTESALVQNTWPDPNEFPKMIWATNYTRLACQTIFTLFYGGRKFAPKAIINRRNIQDYLQGHFINACQHLARRIKGAGDLHEDVVIGWESMNEPNHGLVGLQDMASIPAEQKLQKGTSPTAWQTLLTGSGRACEIDTWDFGGMGPFKSGSQMVDPQGQTTWLNTSDFDAKYGFKRDPNWDLGKCIWSQHGVWDPASDTLLKSNYFGVDPESGDTINYEYFTNNFFMPYYRRYRDAIREVLPDTIMFCQPPVLEIPPSIKDTTDDDPNMVFAPHWYDGLTLMTKKWNRLWNVDVFGVLRGRYLAPAFAIKLGETAIRNCFRNQLTAIKKEGLDYMGEHPCVFTELGIPYDMNDGHAYETGDYSSQVAAMDANHFALEGASVGFTLWNYTTNNTNLHGDQWDGEDLSVASLSSPLPPHTPSPSTSSSALRNTTNPLPYPTTTTDPTIRAASAFIRPHPHRTHGSLLSSSFTLKTREFEMILDATSPTPLGPNTATEVFLPELHYPIAVGGEGVVVEVSGGKWAIERIGGEAEGIQMLKWWHGGGEQRLAVKPKDMQALLADGDEDLEGSGVAGGPTVADRCREGCRSM